MLNIRTNREVKKENTRRDTVNISFHLFSKHPNPLQGLVEEIARLGHSQSKEFCLAHSFRG